MEVLRSEHRVIEQVLECLERLADQGTVTGTLDWSVARDAVDFLVAFADRCHHGKEETLLFPMLAQKGLSRQYGRTGVMVYEHNQGRRHIRNMARAIDESRQGMPEALKYFVGHARAYVQLLHQHIGKEDHCLFPWVNRSFTEAERQALEEAFDTAMRAEAGMYERYFQVACDLADRLNLPRATLPESGPQAWQATRRGNRKSAGP
jgi:hemerythrin-like domain-containing protein